MYSVQIETSDGTLTRINLGIDYFEKNDITLYRNEAETPLVQGVDWQWDGDRTINLLKGAEPSGNQILVFRNTDKDRAFNIYDGGAPFSRDTLDENFKQLIYLAQEFTEGSGIAGLYRNLNMHGNRVVNMGDPVNAQDAATKAYVDYWDNYYNTLQSDWNTRQDAAIDALIAGQVSDVPHRTLPWLHKAIGGETVITTPFVFRDALVYINGLLQFEQAGAVSISAGTVTLAEPLVLGDEVLILMGSRPAAPDVYPTLPEVSDMIQLALSQLNNMGRAATIGQVDYLAQLRTVEPTATSATVFVKQYATGYLGGNWQFVADLVDKTTPDDGVFTIVTMNGNRWKRVTTGTIDVTWFGMASTNITTALQSAINYVVAQVVERQSFVALPPITIPGGKYSIAGQIHSAPFVDIRSGGGEVTLTCTGDIGAFLVNNNWVGIGNADYPGMDASSAASFLNGTQGRINLVGPGTGVSTKVGVILGNDTITGVLPVREPLMYNVLVTGFSAGVKITTKHTYLCSFERVRLEKNAINLLLDDTTARNSGERVSFTNCVFGDVTDSHMLHNCSGMNINFLNTSMDFSKGRMIRFGASGAYSDIHFGDCHLEHWDDVMIRQAAQIAGAGPNHVNFASCTMLARNGVYNSVRPLVSADSPIYVTIDAACHLIFEKTNDKRSGTLIDFDDVLSNNNVFFSYKTIRPRIGYLTKYGDAINAVVLSGTDGVDITSAGDSSIGIDVVATGGATVKYQTVDGQKALEIAAPSAAAVVSLYYRTPVPVTGRERAYSMCAVRPGGITGALNVSGLARSFGKDTVVEGVLQENLLGTSADTTVDMLPYFTAEGNPTPGTYRFISTPPLSSVPFARSFYIKPGLRFTGFTGTMHVILPAWWFDY